MRRPLKPEAGRPLKPEERDLWRHYARGVNPLRHDVLEEHMAAPRTKSRIKAQPHSYAPPSPPRPRPRDDQTGLDTATARRLRRGQAKIEARLDLHGMRQAEAHDALIAFVLRAQDRGYRCALIITGKGTRGARHSNPYETPGPGVLRTRLRPWLAQAPLRGLVFGLEQAHPRHGGTGAFYVFIRKKS